MRELKLLVRSLVFLALVTVLSALAACTASNYWAGWSTPSVPATPVPVQAAAALQTHTVAAGETAYSIAKRYSVALDALASANDLGAQFAIREGQVLAIPGAAVAQTPAPQEKPALLAARARDGAPHALIWPVTGPVISGFGPKDDGRYNEGVNIGTKDGTPVWAAADGTVTYAGNEIRGYGNLILIRHEDGLVTAYAHNRRLKVKKGEHVHQGEVIALAGATGTVTQPQLHFEVRREGRPVDPVPMLGATAQVATR